MVIHNVQSCVLLGETDLPHGVAAFLLQVSALSMLKSLTCSVSGIFLHLMESVHLTRLWPSWFRDWQSALTLLQNLLGCCTENSLLWALSPASVDVPEVPFENFRLNCFPLTKGLKEAKSEREWLFLVGSWLCRNYEWDSQPEGNQHLLSYSWIFVFFCGLLLFGMNPPNLSHMKNNLIKTQLA